MTYVCPECAKLDKGAFDCTASKAIRAQLAFERRLKKAISECELDKAISDPCLLPEAIEKLGDMKSVKEGTRFLKVNKYDDEDELYDEDDYGEEDGC